MPRVNRGIGRAKVFDWDHFARRVVENAENEAATAQAGKGVEVQTPLQDGTPKRRGTSIAHLRKRAPLHETQIVGSGRAGSAALFRSERNMMSHTDTRFESRDYSTSTEPRRVVAPLAKRRASAKLVLPAAPCPASDMFLMSAT